MGAKEYLEMALGGNMNISTLTVSAWEDILTSYSKIQVKESKQPEMLETLKNIIKEYDLDIIQGLDARKVRELISQVNETP